MFFVLSKVLASLAVPSNIILGIGVLGMLLLLTRFRRVGVRLMVTCLLIILLIGVPPIGRGLVAPLEGRFPRGNEAGPPITGIIVLGGPIDSRMSVARGMISIGGDVERFIEGAALARRHPDAKLVFTGGNPSLRRDDSPEVFFAVQ